LGNILNRSQYGNLSCLWAIFKTRFKENDVIKISDLKISDEYSINSIDICHGGQSFPTFISEEIGRNRYCPFLKNRADERICQWVNSTTSDTQKSKPVGQTAIALNICGLAKLNTTKEGRTKSLTWNSGLNEIHNLKWGDETVNEFLIRNILSYGPIIGLAYYLHKFEKKIITVDQIKNHLMVKPSNEIVNSKCSNGSITPVLAWDGNTSSDPSTRTASSLFSLASSIGLVKPIDFPEDTEINPYSYSNWLIERAKNGVMNFPKKFKIQIEKLESVFNDELIVKNGINYIHFIPKATDRNEGNICRCCKKNVINNARKQYGEISRNRKFLLLESLRKAKQENKLVNLKELAEKSSEHNSFCINKETQYSTLLNIERFNIIFYGFPNTIIKEHYLKPLVNTSENSFGKPPYFVGKMIDDILAIPNIFV